MIRKTSPTTNDEYILENNKTYYINGEKKEHISDGELVVTKTYEIFDGEHAEKQFEIGGTAWNGAKLHTSVIDAGSISSIRNWVIREYGSDVILDHRQTAAQYAIEHLMN